MYTLYTDKPELFKCNIDLEGASISDTKARLVIESKDISLLFEGEISSDGSCAIKIPKLKDYLKENKDGIMKLEVIAEDTFFSPWEDTFNLKASKKVTVEVTSSREELIKESRPTISVEVAKKPKTPAKKLVENKKEIKKAKPLTEKHGVVIAKLFERKGVNLKNINKKSEVVNKILETYLRTYDIKVKPDQLLNEILLNLK